MKQNFGGVHPDHNNIFTVFLQVTSEKAVCASEAWDSLRENAAERLGYDITSLWILCSPSVNIHSPMRNIRSPMGNVRSATLNIDFQGVKRLLSGSWSNFPSGDFHVTEEGGQASSMTGHNESGGAEQTTTRIPAHHTAAATKISEGVAYGKMEGKGVLEFPYVVVSAPVGIGRSVESNAEVEAQYKELKVVAYAHAGTKGKIVEESGCLQGTTGALLVLTQEPYVAGIKEQGSLQTAHEGETIFHIGLKLEIARLVHIGIPGPGSGVAAGADSTYGKGAYAVSTADKELVAVGGHIGVAV